MKKIIYTRPDGGLSVVHPMEGARLAFSITLANGAVLPEGSTDPLPADAILRHWPVAGAVANWAETEDQFVVRLLASSVPADAVNVQIVDGTAIPKDRTFRNAWVYSNGIVSHDMGKCRAIHRANLRSIRAPLLVKLDVEYMRALEAGDQSQCSAIAAKKNSLRDVTDDPAIDSASTPEELKTIIPKCLSQT